MHNSGWKKNKINILRVSGIGIQIRKASPVKPWIQVQTGEWFMAWQIAFWPHVPGQGSWHLDLVQAKFAEQSESITHSGLHPS